MNQIQEQLLRENPSEPVYLGENQPLRLQEACATLLGGRLTPKALRLEAKRGNLEIVRIAGKDFVTPAAVKEMVKRCRVQGSQLDSNSRQPQAGKSTGLSGMGSDVSRQDAFAKMLRGLRGR